MSIEGKVAAILNQRELIINKGDKDGVKQDMKFKVIELEVEIKDPDTEEPLGTFSREKIRVKIGEVQAKYSVGRTYETYVVNVGGEGRGMFDIFDGFRRIAPRQEVTRVRTLRRDDITRFEPMGEESSFVIVGDLAVQIAGDL